MTPAGGINYTNSSISIAAITYKEIHYEDVKRQGLLDGTTWDEYKSQNSADTKMTVDQDMYSLVANATGINESNITIIAYESPIFYDGTECVERAYAAVDPGTVGICDIAQHAYQTGGTAGGRGICGEYAAVYP